jgi:hypothetical protein
LPIPAHRASRSRPVILKTLGLRHCRSFCLTTLIYVLILIYTLILIYVVNLIYVVILIYDVISI